MQWLVPWIVLDWLVCGKPVKPSCDWFVVYVPLAMSKPAIDPYSGGIMPSLGVAALLRY